MTEVCTSISEEPTVSICSVRDITTDLAVYSVKSHKTVTFTATVIKISNPTIFKHWGMHKS